MKFFSDKAIKIKKLVCFVPDLLRALLFNTCFVLWISSLSEQGHPQ